MKFKRLIPLFAALSIALIIVTLVSADTTADILNPTEASSSACIGSDVNYTFRITNAGSLTTSFTITYSGTWPHEGPSTTGDLDPGEFMDIQVSVYIPWWVEPGEHDALILTVVGGGLSDTATATTTASFINGGEHVANTPRCVRWG